MELRDSQNFNDDIYQQEQDQEYEYVTSYHQNCESPRYRKQRPIANTEIQQQNSPSFCREQTHSEFNPQQKQKQNCVPDYTNMFQTQIVEKLKNILAYSGSNNKNVMKGLNHLRIMQQIILENMQESNHSIDLRSNNFKDIIFEMNGILNEIISNSELENDQFQNNLQDLRNLNCSLLNERVQYEQYSDQLNKVIQVRSNTQKICSDQNETHIQKFLDGISNIQERLFNEIIILRQQKLDAIRQLNIERQKNYDLERRYKQLERDYRKLESQQNSNTQIYGMQTQNVRNTHFENGETHARTFSKNRNNSNKSILNQINQMENRLRDASKQKIHLQNQIHHFKHQSEKQKFNLESDEISHSPRISRILKKEAQPYFHDDNNDSLQNQLLKLRSQNDKLRKQTIFRESSHIQKDKYQDPNYRQRSSRDHYTSNSKFQTYQLQNSDVSPSSRTYNNYEQKLNQYRQVLNNIRSINR